jgi:hypothetical protein
MYLNAEASIENNVKRKEYSINKTDCFVFMTWKVSRSLAVLPVELEFRGQGLS